jgi:hypothetical protein
MTSQNNDVSSYNTLYIYPRSIIIIIVIVIMTRHVNNKELNWIIIVAYGPVAGYNLVIFLLLLLYTILNGRSYVALSLCVFRFLLFLVLTF